MPYGTTGRVVRSVHDRAEIALILAALHESAANDGTLVGFEYVTWEIAQEFAVRNREAGRLVFGPVLMDGRPHSVLAPSPRAR